MSFVALNYANVNPTTLTANISATTSPLPITSVTWPLVTPFEIVIDRGNLNQEVCLVTAGATSTSLPVTRNYDGKGALGHNSGATVEMSATSIDWFNFNLHATGQARDDHTNLMTSARHQSAQRHQMGISLPGGFPTTSKPADVQSDGTGSALAYADHVHPRSDTWGTYLNYMIRPGMVIPTNPGFSDSRFLVADGRWYNQDDWPLLYSFVGRRHPPLLHHSSASSPYNPLIHFAVPAMGDWDDTFTTFTPLFGLNWVVHASF